MCRKHVMFIIISLCSSTADTKKKFAIIKTNVDKVSNKDLPIVGKGFMDSDETVETDEVEYEDSNKASKKLKKNNRGFLSGLRDTLGIVTPNKMFRSSGEAKKHLDDVKKMNNLVVNSLMTENEPGSQPITVCPPTSMLECMDCVDAGESPEKDNCNVTIPEIGSGWKRSSKCKLYEKWNEDLKKDPIMSLFPKGMKPPTLSNVFSKASKAFADKHLLSERKYPKLLAKMAFLKAHCDVNKELLDQAIAMALFSRKDISNDVHNPAENIFLDKKNPERTKTIKIKTHAGSDYYLDIPRRDHDLRKLDQEHLSGDPEQAKLDYWREESLFHAFHVLFHELWNRIKEDVSPDRFKRTFELFFYTHQQVVRRYAVERYLLGLKPVVPLDPTEFAKSLGPEYKTGWYAVPEVGGRMANCMVANHNATFIVKMKRVYEAVKNQTKKKNGYEEFLSFLEDKYHWQGHMFIAQACSPIFEPTWYGMGVMAYSEVSARDPIFYRWHTHIEDLIQEFRDRQLPFYREGDFDLSDGIEIASVNTMIVNDVGKTKTAIENVLITFWENANISYSEKTKIYYERMNHLNFEYQIHIKNPKGVSKKVLVRLWLGSLEDENDISSYQTNHMIEMDQFVHTLSGQLEETIERKSMQSAVTMKEQDGFLNGLMRKIRNKTIETGTWCGFPHNLLLPRSADYDPSKENLGGRNFGLFAFVTDVDDDVIVGSDGIEHVLCGHKDKTTKLDGKPFGFPFDRRISFEMKENHEFLAMALVKVVYISENHKKEDVFKNLHKLKFATKKVCETVSGPAPGVPCVIFPFTYMGSTHKKCTGLEHTGYWCATETDSDGNYLTDKWGECNCQSCVCSIEDSSVEKAAGDFEQDDEDNSDFDDLVVQMSGNVIKDTELIRGNNLPVVFEKSQTFNIERKNLLTVLEHLGKEFIISFDLLLHKIYAANYMSILHLTNGANCCFYGTRTPAVWLLNDGFTVVSAINGIGNNYNHIRPSVKPGTWVHFKISQTKRDNKYMFDVNVDGKKYWTIENTVPAIFASVSVSAGDEWHEPVSGQIKNLTIQTN